MELLLALSVFCVVFLLHIALHRVLLGYGYVRFSIMSLYLFGGIVLIVVLFFLPLFPSSDVSISIPTFSIFLYGVLVSYVFSMYTVPVLKTQMPTSVILESFRSKNTQSYEDIRKLFPGESVVLKRLKQLEDLSLVRRQGRGYVVTRRGGLLVRAVELYSKLFHHPVGG